MFNGQLPGGGQHDYGGHSRAERGGEVNYLDLKNSILIVLLLDCISEGRSR